MKRSMKALLMLLVAMTAIGAAITAQADTTCVQPLCTTVDGRVLDPHNNPVPNITIWAQGSGGYRTTTITDQSGYYKFQLANQSVNKGCWLVGATPDMYYALGLGGAFCEDTHHDFLATYRTMSVTPKGREYFYPDATKPVTMDLTVSANSHTNPAPFDKDPMTYTVANHPLASSASYVAEQELFPTRRVINNADGTYTYLWSAHITITPPGKSMVHVDWGRQAGSVFANMMDCRMLWFGFGMQNVSPSNSIPGQIVTLDGVGFGTAQGKIYMTVQNNKSRYLDPSDIVTWTENKIQFVVPADAVSGYFRVYSAGGIGPRCLGGSVGAPSPRQYLTVDAKRLATSAIPV